MNTIHYSYLGFTSFPHSRRAQQRPEMNPQALSKSQYGQVHQIHRLLTATGSRFGVFV
ncbi:MAG: hypothetical protein LRZ84_21965 [Desertifilum sp.]|nr:hypothetical protein [Desertifilum sp.]